MADIAKAADIPKPNVFYYFQLERQALQCRSRNRPQPLLAEASRPIEELNDPLKLYLNIFKLS